MDAECEARWRGWMIAAQDGDADAYDLLLRDVLPSLRRLAAIVVRDPTTRDDVVQTTLLHLHQARHTYRPERPFGPWLRAVTRNAARDALRAASRRARREKPWDLEADMVGTTSADETPSGAESSGLPPRLQAAVNALPPQQRQAVELLHLEDLSAIEAAGVANSTPGAMRVRAHRAARALRAWLEGHDE